MEIRENLEDAVLGPFFPNGYVIRLGKSQYFQKWGKRKSAAHRFRWHVVFQQWLQQSVMQNVVFGTTA